MERYNKFTLLVLFMLHYYLAAKVSSNYFLLTLIHTTLIVLPYKNINQDFSA